MIALLTFLLVIVFAAHLICVNTAAAAPLVAIWLDRRGRKLKLPQSIDLGYTLGRYTWFGITLGAILGIASGGLMGAAGYPRYFAAFGRMPDYRLHWLAAELVVYLLLLVPFTFRWRWHERRPWLRYLIGFAAATNLLYHFPPMFAILSKVSSDPAWVDVTIRRAEWHQLMLDPGIISRTLHHWFAAAATVGLLTTLLASRRMSRLDEAAQASEVSVIRRSAGIALVATIANIPVGVWFLLSTPPVAQSDFLGGDLLTAGLFIASIILSVGLLHHLAMATLGDIRGRTLLIAALLLTFIIACMSGALHRSRELDYERLPPVAADVE